MTPEQITTLKARAYDLVVAADNIQRELAQVREQIASGETQQ